MKRHELIERLAETIRPALGKKIDASNIASLMLIELDELGGYDPADITPTNPEAGESLVDFIALLPVRTNFTLRIEKDVPIARGSEEQDRIYVTSTLAGTTFQIGTLTLSDDYTRVLKFRVNPDAPWKNLAQPLKAIRDSKVEIVE